LLTRKRKKKLNYGKIFLIVALLCITVWLLYPNLMYQFNKSQNSNFVETDFDNIDGDNVYVQEKEMKLYWFIPDGMRADPDIFNIFEWAKNGELPNIKRMMDNGAYGFSIPTFPSHTPTNFATLFTGSYPKTHGVADGPMHVEGKPLDKVAVGGFNSGAKKVDPIWVTLEKDYDLDVALLSVPGSTPPELDNGITIRGRWGGWGADFHATNFEENTKTNQYSKGRGANLFFFGEPLAVYLDSEELNEWDNSIFESYSNPKFAKLTKYDESIYAYIVDSTDDNVVNYDDVLFTKDNQNIIASLSEGEWSDWVPANLSWTSNGNKINVESSYIINVIKLEDDGFFKIRLFYNNLNEYITKPSEVGTDLVENVGPMVDFVDNFPPQLIEYPEDKNTFLDEAGMSFDWHKNAISYVLENYNPDVFINDIYTPNQMLTSRWWMGYIDPNSTRYNDVTQEEREQLWFEVKDMYKQLDLMVGELLDHADENTCIVLSSDHGAVPLDKWVNLNNLFAQKGWLKYTIDDITGKPIIDWENSTVIYLKMDNVYINPNGLDGNYTRASGEEYESLRAEVTKALYDLVDPETKIKPVVQVHNYEDVPDYLDLPIDRVGDLVIVNEAGYGWNEEMTQNKEIFSLPLKTGYKQAILADIEKGMWTPFVIMCPGVKHGYFIEEPIRHVNQYPTIMSLMGKEYPDFVEGSVLTEIME
jgi:predicted AlkP superfamily phosphohydrolase/phosphomutase